MSEKIRTENNPKTHSSQVSLVTDLFERYYESVFRYLYYRVSDRAVAEDLASEVFLRLIGALPGRQAGSISFRAWLFQIARNLAIDHYRKTVVRKEIQLVDDLQSKEGDPLDVVERGLTAETLLHALSHLPENQREVLILRFIVAMPVADVAQMLHKSEDAVKGLQHRALRALRESLTEMEVVYV
jgi:RNA polymerase sigma-70 factor, ECF subfamily